MSQTDRLYGLVAGAAVKVPCKAATTANITLSAEQTIDGVAVVTGDRVLVKNQTDASENGIWAVDTGDWSRSKDFDGNLQVVKGTFVYVTNGSTNVAYWRVTTDNDIEIGSDDIDWEKALVNDAGDITFTQAGTGAVARSAENKMQERFSVVDFGADPTGAADSSAAIALALAAMSNPSQLIFPKGTFLVNTEILIPYTGPAGSGKSLHFEGCQILAGANGMNVIHWADCYGHTSGRVTLSSNGKTGITCFRLSPTSESSTTVLANQNFNTFGADIVFTGADEGIVLLAGPRVTGTDSGCWYNKFTGSFVFTSVKRAIWFKDNSVAADGRSGPNANVFTNAPIMNGSINTGIQGDAGGGNVFIAPQFENITLGATPNATPTALKWRGLMTNGGTNYDNVFIAPHWENCTRHWFIDADLCVMMYHADDDITLTAGGATLQTHIPAVTNAGMLADYVMAGIRSRALVERVRILASGAMMLGTTFETGLSAGDLALKNGAVLRGLNAAGNDYHNLLSLTAGDVAELGSGDVNLKASSAQWAAWSPALVTIGAVDSGGAGFRLLRIPNA